jgi:hypothetical protein
MTPDDSFDHHHRITENHCTLCQCFLSRLNGSWMEPDLFLKIDHTASMNQPRDQRMEIGR